jgi:dihydroorotase
MSSEVLIVNGRLLDPSLGIDGVRHLAIRGGRVAEVREQAFEAGRLAAAQVIDARGQWVMPGFIDLHVHLREPGEEYKETVQTGTGAARAGGFTAVACMPNTKPPNDSAAVTELILRKAQEGGATRVYPIGTISKGLKGEELSEVGELVAAGCRGVSDDGRPVSKPTLMRRALEYTRAFGIPVMAHEEDLGLAGEGVMHEGEWSTRLGLRGIPGAAEEAMIARDLSLLELTQGKLHICHVSSAGSVRLIREAKRRGLPVTAEATPHHFTLTDRAVVGYDTRAKMNPPLRSEADRAAVVEALADGTLDAIATDHAPHSPVEKELEFDVAANGIIGLETALPLSLALVRTGALPPLRLAELLSSGPARILGVPGGTLAVGSVADATVVDPEAEWTCDAARLVSKSHNTPFDGWKLVGKASITLLEGGAPQARAQL